MSHDVQVPFLFQALHLLQYLSMVDLPESMKTGGFDPRQAQAELEAAQNRSRRQQQSSPDQENLDAIGQRVNEVRQNVGAQPLGAPLQMPNVPAGAGGSDDQSQPWTRENDPLTRAEATANQLNADRALARGKKPPSEKKLAKDKKKQDKLDALSIDKDYSNPITLRGFIAFAGIAVSQDALPLLFDILAIGWIIEYIHLPFTWIAYWYLIIRRAPRSMRKKFWQRTLLITCVGWIPVVGQFIPEWTATAIGAYVVISMYERRKAYEEAGKASQANKTSEAKAPEPAAVA